MNLKGFIIMISIVCSKQKVNSRALWNISFPFLSVTEYWTEWSDCGLIGQLLASNMRISRIYPIAAFNTTFQSFVSLCTPCISVDELKYSLLYQCVSFQRILRLLAVNAFYRRYQNLITNVYCSLYSSTCINRPPLSNGQLIVWYDSGRMKVY